MHRLPADDLELILSLTGEFFDKYRGSNVLVTGASGFVGRWLCETIKAANEQLNSNIHLTALVRDPVKAERLMPTVFAQTWARVIAADIRAPLPLLGAIDLCVHAAAPIGTASLRIHPHDVFDTIFSGTRRIVDAAAAGGATRFLLCSSGAIYGVQPPALERIGETYSGAPDIWSPQSSYGNAKRAAEWWINTLAKEEISPVSARIFAVLGPGQSLDPAFAASSFVRDLVGGNLPEVRDGRPIRSYIYSADLVVWLLTILDVGRAREAYNVGGQDMVSIARLAEMFALAAGRSHYQLDTAPTIGAPPARYVPDTSKARTELGLKDYTPLPNAISKTMVWHLEEKNP